MTHRQSVARIRRPLVGSSDRPDARSDLRGRSEGCRVWVALQGCGPAGGRCSNEQPHPVGPCGAHGASTINFHRLARGPWPLPTAADRSHSGMNCARWYLNRRAARRRRLPKARSPRMHMNYVASNDVLIRTLLGTWDPTTLAYISTPRCVCRNSHRGESSLANMFISKATKMSNILGT